MAKKIQPTPPFEENFSLIDSDCSQEEYEDDEQEQYQEGDEQESDEHASEVDDSSGGEPNSQLEASGSKSHLIRNFFICIAIAIVLFILPVLLPSFNSNSATSKTITTTYVVQSGDCWSKIARQYNTTVNNLLKLNSELVKDVPRDSSGTPYIYTGWEILVPVTDGQSTTTHGIEQNSKGEPPSSTTVYVVKDGDCWSKIAREHNTDINTLLELNKKQFENVPRDTSGIPYIYTGWEILVPQK